MYVFLKFQAVVSTIAFNYIGSLNVTFRNLMGLGRGVSKNILPHTDILSVHIYIPISALKS